MRARTLMAVLLLLVLAVPVPAAQRGIPLANPTRAAEESRPLVVILATGGTIAGSGATSTTTAGYTAATVPVEALLRAVPELASICRVRGEQVFQIASENMTDEHLLTLARRVNAVLAEPGVAGVVVTHGTDTMEETAYFLNLTVASRKPVVLVGAMRPATALSADGPLNLFSAAAVAASPDAVGRGVLVAMNDRIFPAREATKTNTANLDTFQAPEFGALGVIVAGTPRFYRASTRRHTLTSEFAGGLPGTLPRVEIVLSAANAGREVVDRAVAGGVRGLVYAGTGNGSIATVVRPAIIDARAKGLVIVRSSRTGSGVVARNGEVDDDAFDLVAGDNLTPQKARLLLALALARGADTRQIQRMFAEY